MKTYIKVEKAGPYESDSDFVIRKVTDFGNNQQSITIGLTNDLIFSLIGQLVIALGEIKEVSDK